MEIQFRMSKVYKKKLGYSCVKIKTGKPDSQPQLPSGETRPQVLIVLKICSKVNDL